MRRFSGAFRFNFPAPLFFCLAAASFAGSLWANGLSEPLQERLGVLGLAWLGEGGYTVSPGAGLAASVILRRLGEAAVLWILGMTPVGRAGFCLFFASVGFAAAVVLSVLTMQAGILALPLFLLSLFPQLFFYIPVVSILARWGTGGEKRLHGAAFAILLALTALGAASETLVSPAWMKLAVRLLRWA